MIAIVSHDAGGAEILSSWIRQNHQAYCLALDGPAIEIFRRKLGEIELLPLEEVIRKSDWVLCGTSWQSDLEKNAIEQSKFIGKRVVAFLDHWIDYPVRFRLNGRSTLPDEIWVSDADAFRLARHDFQGVKVVLTKNPYFEDLLIEMRDYSGINKSLNGKSVLYVCEPLREHAQIKYGNPYYWGYTEEEALIFFLENVGAMGVPVDSIKVRPHPSERFDKYQWATQHNVLVSETFSKKSLIDQIIESDIVVGAQSMAMVVALMARKRVITSVPPRGRKCELPQADIESLQNLVHMYQGRSDA